MMSLSLSHRTPRLYLHPQEVTRLINERNEAEYARKATQSGGSLTVVRALRRTRAPAAARSPNPPARAAPPQIRPPPDAHKASAKLKPHLKAPLKI